MTTLSKLKPEQILYDVCKYRCNGGGSEIGLWFVKVIEVHEDYALCSWNGNKPIKYSTGMIKRLKVNKPKII